MTTLLDDRYAPITSSIGFLKMPLEEAAEALAAWRRSLAPPVSIKPLGVSLEDALCQLDPLELRSRELLVAVDGGWTAYFDCSVTGTDAVSPMGFLARTNQCDAASITTIAGSKRRGGSITFEMYGPQPTEWLITSEPSRLSKTTAGGDSSRPDSPSPSKTLMPIGRDGSGIASRLTCCPGTAGRSDSGHSRCRRIEKQSWCAAIGPMTSS